ncbi:MAG: chromosomal replication initiator protein DnaA [Pseudomonadales bacterium]|nr:chromosomal replication initiator protein DnaA [Pseudomonadales bacterium]
MQSTATTPILQKLDLDQAALNALWQETCLDLTSEVSAMTVSAWARPAKLVKIESFEDDRWICTINSPSSFNALQFEKDLSIPTKKILTQKLGKEVELRFDFSLPQNQTPTPKKNTSLKVAPTKEANHEENSLFASNTISESLASRVEIMAKHIGLKADNTFKSFAVSTSNEMAHAAAKAVAKNPGVNYNPLFLYGGVGVGKTHLMHAIGNKILNKEPEAKIIYCTGEDFTNEIIRAIQNKRTSAFKEKYRGCRALLIDDIQFIAGKNTVQEEFFHTFNALVNNYQQIIMTSDRPPHEINLLEDRLRSRFEAGLVVDIQQPSFELRTAILLIKTKARNINLSMELAQLIAARVDSARKIEGLIVRIQSEIELKGRTVNQELIEELLHEETKNRNISLRLNPNEILTAVANHFKLKQTLIKGQKRQKEVVLARHIAMFLFKNELKMSYVEIGKWFGGRDHTSVMHGVQKINQESMINANLDQDISTIKLTISGRPN